MTIDTFFRQRISEDAHESFILLALEGATRFDVQVGEAIDRLADVVTAVFK